MELYILDNLLRRTAVIDVYESLIWTERYSEVGDFELVISSTPKNRALLVNDTRVIINLSHRVMNIDTVDDRVDEEGKALLEVKGHSLESILDDRIIREGMEPLFIFPAWDLTGTPVEIAQQMFFDICQTGILDDGDVLPFFMSGWSGLFDENTIDLPAADITWHQDITTLYEAIKGICDFYNLGFRIVRKYDESELYFEVYIGFNRTTAQTVLPPVVFSVDFQNFQNTEHFTSTSKSKNTVYIISNQLGGLIAYPSWTDPDVEGFERRVLLYKADDITIPDGMAVEDQPAYLTSVLTQRGLEELEKYRDVSIIDGEVTNYNSYIYGTDYNVGDVIEIRNADNVTAQRRVSEQIFVCDAEGERLYPTLSLNPIRRRKPLRHPHFEKY